MILMIMTRFLWQIPLIALAASCTAVEQPFVPAPQEPERVFARIESVTNPDSKVYADENLKVLWDSDDRISLFDRNTANRQFRFTGNTGDNAGEFTEVTGDTPTGSSLDCVFSVYPYNEGNAMSSDGIITLDLPAGQVYREGSFGPGANVMVSATEDKNLLFKNLCGYFILKLYGDNVSVSSIKLEATGQEPLAGSVNVSAGVGQIPSISFNETGTSSALTLTCASPVTLGSTAETATAFWMAVPPTTFGSGFKITVTDADGQIFEKSTSHSYTVQRNTTFFMKALKVTPEPVYLVTNHYVQDYLESISYDDFDFTESPLRGSTIPGGVLYDTSITPDADIPPSVTIEWEDSSSSLVLDLQDNAGWERTYSVSRKTSLEVTNLIPGRHYTYQVHKDGSSDIKAQGGFYTRGALHQVFYQDRVRNGRDIGGWKTLDGKTVRYGKLYRGGRLSLNSEGRKEILADGILAELDLRSKKETSNSLGSGYSFCGPGFDSGYINGMLEGNPNGVKECFEFTVNCLRENEPIYFHCSAGRDRTGTMAILYLGLLGVREGDIARDYELTYFSPAEWSLETVNGVDIYNHTREVSTYRATVEYLRDLSSDGTLKSGAEQYLRFLEVALEDINDFRSLMLE